MEDRNLHIEWRWAEGRTDRLPAPAAELVQAKVELIVALTLPPSIVGRADRVIR